MKLFWLNIQIRYWHFIHDLKSLFTNTNKILDKPNCSHEFVKKLYKTNKHSYTHKHVCKKCGLVKFNKRSFRLIS